MCGIFSSLCPVGIYLRSFRATLQFSSFFATMEQEIPPWKNGRRNPIMTGSNEIDRWVNWRRDIDEIHVYTRTYVLRKYNILRRSLHVTIYSSCWSQIKCHRSWRSSFQLSSVFATMEQEIPPWKNGRRSPIITGSNEIDRWVNWRRYYSGTTLYYKVLLQYYSVLQSTTPVLLWTTKYYSSTTLYNKVLRHYYSVLQSTTPVLLCTTKYYSGTTLYYKVLLLYYSVLQSTTLYYKVLLCTTKYYASTTPVLLCTARRNKSHRPTWPNTAPGTQNECHQWSPSHMKAHFQCVEPVKSPSNLTKYCACHAKWMSSMICVTYGSSFPMRGASQVTLQPHQILHLPRKMNVRNDLRHIWNLISNACCQ